MEIRREWCGDPCTEDCHIQSLQRPGTTGESVDDWDTQYHLDGKLCPTCGGTGTINGRWELRMSLPNPEDGWLHMPMTDLNGRHSYYKLGY